MHLESLSSCKVPLSLVFRAEPRLKPIAPRSPPLSRTLLASLLILSSSSSSLPSSGAPHFRQSPFAGPLSSFILSLHPWKRTMQNSIAHLSSSPSSSCDFTPSKFQNPSWHTEENVSLQDSQAQQNINRQQHKRFHPSPPPSRPTHFLAVKLSSPSLHSSIKSIQDEMIEMHGPTLEEAMVSPSKLHLTLAVLHLEDEDSNEEEEKGEEEGGWKEEGSRGSAPGSTVTLRSETAVAAAVLAPVGVEEGGGEERGGALGSPLLPSLPPSFPRPTVSRTRALISSLMQEEVRPWLLRENGGKPPSLRLVGLGSFGERVVFVRPDEEEEEEGGKEGGAKGGTRWMQQVVMRIRERLFEEGLTKEKPPKGIKEVFLHATIAKMRVKGGRKGRGKKGGREASLLRREVWMEHDKKWGLGGEEQVLETLQLLEMQGDGEGYYERVEEWQFVERKEERRWVGKKEG